MATDRKPLPMKTFTQFRADHRDKEIGSGQCVAEIRAFLKEVCGCTTNTYDWIAPGNAVDFFRNASSAHFKKVYNSPDNHPPDGAIVVAHHVSRGSDGQYRDYGHVFNSLRSTVYYLRGYGQNWSLVHECDYEYHPHYNETNWHVIGWLIPLAHFTL